MRINNKIYSAVDGHIPFLTYHPTMNLSEICELSRWHTNKQTHEGENITSFADVITDKQWP